MVLGIAQDGGIPHLGCTQEICRTQHHFVSSLAILHKDQLYFIDATPDFREQYAALVQKYPAFAKRNIADGIFLTHAHMGHYTGLMYLGKESISTKQLPVYGSSQMSAFLKQNAPWSLLVSNQNIEIREFTSGKAIDLNGLSVTPIEVPHRKEFTDTHGFLISGGNATLLYIPDIDSWEPVRESLGKWLQNSNYALLDGTFYSGDELPGRDISLVPHPTVRSSIPILQSFPPHSCQIYFTHLNHTNPLLDRTSPEFLEFQKTGFHIATEFLELPL